MTAGQRSAALLAAVLAGLGVAWLLNINDVDKSSSYELFVTALLGFGLYASTRGIKIAEFRNNLRTVLLAVTLGVLAKAILIFGVMFLVFRDPEYIVLGIVVAQIDPLSVAAMHTKSKMSDSAKALLAAWASFDDPITVLLTVYFAAFALQARNGTAGGNLVGAGAGSFALSLLGNLVLAGACYGTWLAVRRALRQRVRRRAGHSALVQFALRGGTALTVLAVGFVAVQFSLLLALAVCGLFFRPALGQWLDNLTNVALLMATFAVGLVLIGGVTLAQGVVLGSAAYGAQIVVALVLTVPRAWRGDRGRLALGQQNGMTAIVLALLLEPSFPGTIAIVAPAILVVNVLHAVCNGLWDRLHPAPPTDDAADSTDVDNAVDRAMAVPVPLPGKVIPLQVSPRWQTKPAAQRAERAG